nr:PH domain-containing protein [Pseudactinotalea sp. HY160]
MVLGVIVLAALIGLVYNYIAWRRLAYGFDDESLFLHQGVLFRSQRHVRLDRIQSVDINHPLLARAFGFAAVKVTSAGTSASSLTLAFVTDAEGHRLRNEILARAAGLDLSEDDGAPPAVAQEAPESVLLELEAGRLAGSLLRSLGLVLGVVAVIVLLGVAVVTRNPSVVFSFIVPIFAVGSMAWARLNGQFGFRVATSPDGIRLRYGMLATTSRTVPPGRVQALQLTQPILWRRKNWWRVAVTVAGDSVTEGSVNQPVLYPVATQDDAALLLSLVLPDLGVEDPLAVIDAALRGSGPAEGFVTTPRRARFIDPLVWRRNGYRATDTAVLLRTGRVWRSLTIVPNARIQSLGLDQGPIERRLDLVNVAVHSTPGTISPALAHLDSADASRFLVEQSARARAARVSAGPERWMERPHAERAETPVTIGEEDDAGGRSTDTAGTADMADMADMADTADTADPPATTVATAPVASPDEPR